MRPTRAECLTALLITGFAAALHVLRLLYAGALWRDETAALALATLPSLREVAGSFQHEAFPLLFPLAVRAWTAVCGGAGASNPALRAFGLAVGLAEIAAFWLAARWTAGRPPLFSLALAGLNPAVLIFGDSLRGYGLGTVFLLLTFGLLGRLVARPGRWTAAATAVAAVASAQCLLHAAPLLLALCGSAAVAAAVARRRPAALGALAAGALAALSLLPYAPALAGARSWNVLVVLPITPANVATELARTAGAPIAGMRWVWLLLFAVAAAGLARPPGTAAARDADRAVRLYCLLALPALALAQCAFLSVLRYEPRPWYYVPLIALAAAALEAPLAAAASTPVLRGARLAAAALIAAALALPMLQLARMRMTNVDLVAARIAAQAAPEDLVIVDPWFHGISFARYYRGAAPWTTLPAIPDHRFHRYDLIKARMMEPAPLAGVFAAAARTLRSGHRVWLAGEVEFPAPGRQPLVLKPAPQAASGWIDIPYLESWSQQAGGFARDYALAVRRIEVPAPGAVSGFERLPLAVAWGWTGP